MDRSAHDTAHQWLTSNRVYNNLQLKKCEQLNYVKHFSNVVFLFFKISFKKSTF